MKKLFGALCLMMLLFAAGPAYAVSDGIQKSLIADAHEAHTNDGGAINHGMTNVLVDRFGICRWLDNNDAAKDFFVPTGNAADWQSFLDHHPSPVITSACCPVTSASLTASDGQVDHQSLPIGHDADTTVLGKRMLSHAFTVGAGTETVAELYTCTAGVWVGSGQTHTSVPTACATPDTASCEGSDFVTRHCDGTEAARSVNDATCSSCSSYSEDTYPACGAGYTGTYTYTRTVSSCSGTGPWIQTANNCVPLPTCTVTVETSTSPCPSGYTGTVTYSRNNNSCSGPDAWSETGNSCAAVPPPLTCGDGEIDEDGWFDGAPYCNNFNLFAVLCDSHPDCTVNITENSGSRCAGTGHYCY